MEVKSGSTLSVSVGACAQGYRVEMVVVQVEQLAFWQEPAQHSIPKAYLVFLSWILLQVSELVVWHHPQTNIQMLRNCSEK